MDSGLSVSELITKCLSEKKDFVVNGGAGSGKTYSLIETLNSIFSINNMARVACITYTKVAANEISKRVVNKNNFFHVSTIHEFLWRNISNYQVNLKNAIIDMYNKNVDGELLISFPDDFDIELFEINILEIKYRDYRKLNEGIISHDDVIKLSSYMFKKFRRLCDIANDRYDYILIDEYQDSSKRVIDIFLNEIRKVEGKNCVFGLFGDPMQKIYQTGIGSLDNYDLKIINKEDNWRSSQTIVSLINKFRNDGLIQVAKGENKDYKSKCTFVYSENKSFFDVKDVLYENNYINQNDEYKELYLTHNLIGTLNGSKNLFNLYSQKEKLIGDSKDAFIKQLDKIETIRQNYINKRHFEILRNLSMKIRSVNDKKIFCELMSKTFSNINCTIGDMIDICDKNNVVCKDDDFNFEIKESSDFYDKLKQIPYIEYINCYSYANHNTPFSTQHGVKGEEYNNVVVVLDNGNWNLYDYSKVLNGENNDSKYDRSLKIMYVSFSRAKNNLCVFYHNPSIITINYAKEIFGSENVKKID